jgi:hypothetical protein
VSSLKFSGFPLVLIRSFIPKSPAQNRALHVFITSLLSPSVWRKFCHFLVSTAVLLLTGAWVWPGYRRSDAGLSLAKTFIWSLVTWGRSLEAGCPWPGPLSLGLLTPVILQSWNPGLAQTVGGRHLVALSFPEFLGSLALCGLGIYLQPTGEGGRPPVHTGLLH